VLDLILEREPFVAEAVTLWELHQQKQPRVFVRGYMNKPDLHPEILIKNGKKEFAVLPYEEFVALQEWLADIEDLIDLRLAKETEHDASALSLTELESRFNDAN